MRRQTNAIQPCSVITHLQATINKPAYHQWVNGMFLSLNPCRDIIFAVAFKYRNFGLKNNGSAVQFISDEVD